MMFAVPVSAVEGADIEDAIGELCSVVSGQVKVLTVPGAGIGLPQVVHGNGRDLPRADAQLLCELPFSVGTEFLLLTIERDRYAEVAA